MKRKTSFHAAAYIIVVLACSLAFLPGCGSDKVAPADPSSTSVIPNIVFFNTGAASPKVLFEGRATDNTRVNSVEISFDNGTSWLSAAIDDSTPPNKPWNLAWSYLASETDIPAVMNTVRIKAVDGEGNEAMSSAIIVEKQKGATAASLLAAFSGAGPGDVIALSSGSGGAYGNGSSALTIPIDVDLTVLGSGYGNDATSGGFPFPDGTSTATVLNSGLSASSIFSVDADLTLKKMRILGAREGISVNDVSAGHDPQLVVEDCVFDGQDSWAVDAVDNDEGVIVQFLNSFVDASTATSARRGGLYLEGVQYLVESSEFYYQTDPGGPDDGSVQGAGVQVVGGIGDITDSIFDDNALAIWASGGSPAIDSCTISGSALATNGIDLSGSGTSPTVQYNVIQDNNGFAVRIRGDSKPKLFGNDILKADQNTYPDAKGIWILDPGSMPELGKFPWDESGCNKFESGSSLIEDFVIEVDGSTSAASVFFAGNNFWGDQFATGNEINTYKIHDGKDGDNTDAAKIDLTGTPGGTTPIIWDGTGVCP